MRYLVLFLAALIAFRLTFPPEEGLALWFSYGVVGFQALLFSGVAWFFARRSKDNEGWIIAGGWMLLAIALVRYGNSYQAAKGSGLSSDQATSASLSGWIWLLALIGIAAIIYAKWHRRRAA
ncbi:hypothetical protein [Sphingomonas sp. LHG3443-2]|uniref:hypothetical protein n=1 Tax=Sphingomonas sp. LHG3443-2 TaxID=2804639 RepID=UPI003CF0F28B